MNKRKLYLLIVLTSMLVGMTTTLTITLVSARTRAIEQLRRDCPCAKL